MSDAAGSAARLHLYTPQPLCRSIPEYHNFHPLPEQKQSTRCLLQNPAELSSETQRWKWYLRHIAPGHMRSAFTVALFVSVIGSLYSVPRPARCHLYMRESVPSRVYKMTAFSVSLPKLRSVFSQLPAGRFDHRSLCGRQNLFQCAQSITSSTSLSAALFNVPCPL